STPIPPQKREDVFVGIPAKLVGISLRDVHRLGLKSLPKANHTPIGGEGIVRAAGFFGGLTNVFQFDVYVETDQHKVRDWLGPPGGEQHVRPVEALLSEHLTVQGKLLGIIEVDSRGSEGLLHRNAPAWLGGECRA